MLLPETKARYTTDRGQSGPNDVASAGRECYLECICGNAPAQSVRGTADRYQLRRDRATTIVCDLVPESKVHRGSDTDSDEQPGGLSQASIHRRVIENNIL